MQHDIVAALEAIPGVESAAFTNALPMDRRQRTADGIEVEGRADGNGDAIAPCASSTYMSPGSTCDDGHALARGPRSHVDDRRAAAASCWYPRPCARAVADPDAALRQAHRHPAALGARSSASCTTCAERPRPAPPATVYWPTMMADSGQTPARRSRDAAWRSCCARRSRGTPALTRQIEQAVWSVNPSLPVASVRTMQDLYDRSLGRTSFTLVMLVAAAAPRSCSASSASTACCRSGARRGAARSRFGFALGAQQRATSSGASCGQGVVLAGIGVAIGLGVAAAR